MKERLPYGVSLLGALLGLIFGFYSTLDYSAHLDRRLHDVHCSFIPGAAPTSEAEACRAAMYSPYSAFFKDAYWGGIPISLFALGAFSFFLGFAAYLLISGSGAPKRSRLFFAVVGSTPLVVSLTMLTISLTQLGSVCKTCAGIYIGSTVLAIGAWWGAAVKPPTAPAKQGNVAPTLAMDGAPKDKPSPALGILLPIGWLAALGLLTLLPSLVYAAQVPDQRPYLGQCGKLKQASADKDKLLKLVTARSVRQATLFEDPLCPTCRAFHERLVHEDIFDKLNAELALFPLDNECNWMLDTALHPGACTVSKAVICGGDQSRQVLDWAYENQEQLSAAGKAGKDPLRAAIQQRWGPSMMNCIDTKTTKDTLNRHLQFAAANSIPVSTPQIYLSGQRICDEDTDIGLRYTLGQLAPELFK
ncbi:MAG: vitamin K epoxide reductase family protein [Polyangiaceae bacterium]